MAVSINWGFLFLVLTILEVPGLLKKGLLGDIGLYKGGIGVVLGPSRPCDKGISNTCLRLPRCSLDYLP